MAIQPNPIQTQHPHTHTQTQIVERREWHEVLAERDLDHTPPVPEPLEFRCVVDNRLSVLPVWWFPYLSIHTYTHARACAVCL